MVIFFFSLAVFPIRAFRKKLSQKISSKCELQTPRWSNGGLTLTRTTKRIRDREVSINFLQPPPGMNEAIEPFSEISNVLPSSEYSEG